MNEQAQESGAAKEPEPLELDTPMHDYIEKSGDPQGETKGSDGSESK